jgi:hypothetical protein
MLRTQSYREQHDQLLGLAGELGGLLGKADNDFPATQARHLLSEIAGRLTVHLAMEDKHLYPSLLQHGDATVRQTAERFVEEMGGIASVFKTYLANWPSAEAVSRNPAGFRDATKGILKALGGRIQQENTVLYPIMDALA